jgi:hypothetical protein
MAEGDLTDSTDCIINDTMAEETIRHRRKIYHHPVDAQPVQQVVQAIQADPGGCGRQSGGQAETEELQP